MSVASKYILLQRSNFLISRSIPLVNRLPVATRVNLEAMIRSEESIVKPYIKSMEAEYTSLLPALPKQASNILDIGCGLAGIDIFLYRHYGTPTIHLLDKNGLSKELYFGLEAEATFYNSLALAQQLLEKNGVKTKDIVTIDIDKETFPKTKFDIIVSLLAWGFHFPVETYLQEVKRSLSENGVLIIDVRKSSTGEKVLRENFRNVRALNFDDKKATRLVCSM